MSDLASKKEALADAATALAKSLDGHAMISDTNIDEALTQLKTNPEEIDTEITSVKMLVAQRNIAIKQAPGELRKWAEGHGDDKRGRSRVFNGGTPVDQVSSLLEPFKNRDWYKHLQNYRESLNDTSQSALDGMEGAISALEETLLLETEALQNRQNQKG